MEPAESPEQIRFENRYYNTYQTVLSALWAMAAARRYLYITAVVIALVGLLVFGKSFEVAYLLFGITLMGLLLPFLQAWLYRRNYRKLMNGTIPQTILRYTDTEIQGSAARNEYHYQYSQIRRVRSTRQLWLLMFSRQITLIVRKDGFTVGQMQDFPAFIRSKCPNIKGSFN